jgi:hypothetical protein
MLKVGNYGIKRSEHKQTGRNGRHGRQRKKLIMQDIRQALPKYVK